MGLKNVKIESIFIGFDKLLIYDCLGWASCLGKVGAESERGTKSTQWDRGDFCSHGGSASILSLLVPLGVGGGWPFLVIVSSCL